MTHSEEILNYEGNLTTLTSYLIRLNPTSQNTFFQSLGIQLENDSMEDKRRGRINLANKLSELSNQSKGIADIFSATHADENTRLQKDIPMYISMNKLAEQVSLLKYNRMVAFFSYLEDANLELKNSEFEFENPQLNRIYSTIRSQLPELTKTAQDIWKICKPYEF